MAFNCVFGQFCIILHYSGLYYNIYLGFSRYVLDMKTQFADNISANVVGLVLGTIFRYIMYRYVIFTGSEAGKESSKAA